MKRRAFLLLLLLGLPLLGCNRSDAIVVIQLHPKNPDIIYVATNDYIYKTRDGGQAWTNLSRGMSHSRVISMALDPAYPATVYAGTKGDAVYKSHDGGQRWVSMRSGLDDATISSVVNQFLFDPTDSNHIFIATTMGVSETKDGGEHWVKKMEGMKEVLMVVTLGMDPTRPAILYAGTSGGVYKTINEAGHWEKVNNGLVSPDIIKSSRALNVTSVLVDSFEPDTVYASTLVGLYKTTDGGKAWVRIGQSMQDQMLFSMILDRTKKGVIYLGGREGVHRSEDGGTTWGTLNTGLATLNIRSLVQSPTDPDVFYAGTNGSGLYRSNNRGETWESVPTALPSQ
jgi:photosystem II stability/assembly factor-like uncharacterized protein